MTTNMAESVRRKNDAQDAASGRTLLWVDRLILGAALVVSLVSLLAVWQTGAFGLPLASDALLSWHLVRAAGLTAYTLLGASTLWGVFLASRVIKDWSPGPVMLLLHATVSWLALGATVAHVGMLLFDRYYTYTLADLLVPFTGPYRPVAVGLGILSAWLTVAITISFSQRKRIGQQAWRVLHLSSYAVFALITLHALLAGTDASKPGMRLMVGAFAAITAGLLGHRIHQMRRQRIAGGRRT